MADKHPTLKVERGDITTYAVDAIVNAANEALAPGGGVCGAIHRAAGAELAQACARIGSCPTGEARLTPGFRLPARFVIHAVGPVWRGGTAGEDRLLERCYRSIAAIARSESFGTLAVPAISTGIFGFPSQRAAGIAMNTLADALDGTDTFVTFVAFAVDSERDLSAALAALRRPLTSSN
ncbi:MAG TPA: macro domain-containing protein [Alphaproteobacteria bacterium]|jgi:O-acetyl-ADP-ribose deacetylase (regulator of RNase III)|nr:macro domain-containing protein [Alphaproteobacteria bacterium]